MSLRQVISRCLDVNCDQLHPEQARRILEALNTAGYAVVNKNQTDYSGIDDESSVQPAASNFVVNTSQGDLGILFTIKPNGEILRGPAFTTEDEASLKFWDLLAANFPMFRAGDGYTIAGSGGGNNDCGTTGGDNPLREIIVDGRAVPNPAYKFHTERKGGAPSRNIVLNTANKEHK